MKMRNAKISKKIQTTKKGAASLYVVIFTTLLLGVITLSFIRIVISESSQTSNTDLSRSAYDSALAGIEDAKVALLDYHDCLSGRISADCSAIVSNMQQGIQNQSCDVVRDVLQRNTGAMRAQNEGKDEVLIQESNDTSASLLQAYTCVKIAEDLPDYRTTLNSSFRTRIVPLRTSRINDVDSVTISWYSNINGNNSTLNFMPNYGNQFIFQPNYTTYAPPVISFQMIQAGAYFTPNIDFNVPSGSLANRAEAFLYPVSSGGINSISSSSFITSANKMPDDSGEGGSSNRAYKINCNGFNEGKEFACTATIYLPRPLNGNRSDNASFIRVGLPYNIPTTDFSIQLNDAAGNLINFEGVQSSIDSTGRANDLYRRVETRVELVDVYYPYPEFTIQSDNKSSGYGLKKNFYSTRNCWTSDNGSWSGCNNNSQSYSY
ncbi:hypothetical protein IKG16_00025 [Candidatus Saccharibacteria bacterium]|nr:hypothetical protein [Candidatus Saccharibacteria bacterium]